MEAASGSPAPLLCWCVLPARGQWIRRLSLPPGEPSSCRACRVGWGGLISSLVGALKSRDESMCGRSQPLPAASGLAHTPACPRGPRGSGPGHIGSGRLSGASRVEGPWPWGRLGGRGQGGVLRPQNSERGSASWWQMCCARAAVGTRGLSCVSVSCAGTRTHHVALSPGHGVHLVDVVGTRGAAAAWLLLSRLTFSSSSWVHGQRGRPLVVSRRSRWTGGSLASWPGWASGSHRWPLSPAQPALSALAQPAPRGRGWWVSGGSSLCSGLLLAGICSMNC